MSRFSISLLATLILSIAPQLASAQSAAPYQSLDQYPSFVELTSQAGDGTQTAARCGYYSPDGKTIVIDPSYEELSVINHGRNLYNRFQHIDNYILQTTIAPSGSWGLLVQVIKPDGTMYARNCQTDMNNDSLYSCQNAGTNIPLDEMKRDDRSLGSQCSDLIQQNMAQINPEGANVQKSKAFREGLRSKIQMLDTIQ